MDTWKRLSSKQALNELEKLNTLSKEAFCQKLLGYDCENRETDDEEFDECIKSIRDSGRPIIQEFMNNGNRYQFDVSLGLMLFKILHNYDFTCIEACDITVWNYFSVKCFPDWVNLRYTSKDNSNIGNNTHRYCKNKSRNWLCTIWWYIYISLQFKENGDIDYEKTRQILKSGNTDIILQIVDRRGKKGYKLDFLRKLMLKMYTHPAYLQKIRAIMIKDKACSDILEPELCQGGTDGYLDFILDGIERK